MTDEELDLLRTTREVQIETSRGNGAPVHRTTIWVVVDDAGRVLVRTYLGPGSRWYRELLANPDGRLHAGGRVLDVSAVPAADEDRVARCSEELARKYAGLAATPRMLAEANLPTTLELRAR